MAKRSDPVEALAKVLWKAEVDCIENFLMESERSRWSKAGQYGRKQFRAMARAAIAHLSKKRGAKRGK